jgi:hypothetical protein
LVTSFCFWLVRNSTRTSWSGFSTLVSEIRKLASWHNSYSVCEEREGGREGGRERERKRERCTCVCERNSVYTCTLYMYMYVHTHKYVWVQVSKEWIESSDRVTHN